MILCGYGCGREATHKFKNGKLCCKNNVSKCPKIKEIIGKAHEKMIITTKTREAVRKSRLGKKDSEETRKRKSEARKGSRNPNYRKTTSEETRKKMSEARKGTPSHNRFTIEFLEKKYPFFSQIEEMRYNPDKPEEKEIQVHCKFSECENSKENGGWFTPSSGQIYYRKNSLEREGKDYSYFYCSEQCKISCLLFNNKGGNSFLNSLYSKEIFKQEVLRRQLQEYGYNFCEYCEAEENLHVHHEKPQKINPLLVLDPDNGIVFCEKCHYIIGHQDECSTGNLAKKVCYRIKGELYEIK